jgi:dolichol-phosphate mannosyltransferase
VSSVALPSTNFQIARPGVLPPVDVLVIVPTYNERENLPVLTRAVMKHPRFRMMVVDNQSPDGTGQVAESLAADFPGRIEVMHRTGKKGLGRSYIDALMLARDRTESFVCQMDADLSHDPRYLPDMVAAAVEHGHDLVIGSRYLQGVSVVNWPLHRLILSACANRYIRTVTRLPVADCTSGFRCWRREALRRVAIERIVSDGYAFLVEMLYEAHRQGCRIGEVPIIFVERRLGHSKMSGGVIFESAYMPWRVVFRRALRRERPAAGPDPSSAAERRG